MQTCHRHPEAGRFIRTCHGCTRELFNLEQANRVHTDATRALALIGMTVGPHLTILAAHRTTTTLTVITRHEGVYFEYGVDVFRLPTPAETDPDLTDWARRTPGQWILDWQAGDHHPDAVGQMLTDAHQHLTTTGQITDSTPTTSYPAPIATAPTSSPVPLTHLPTRPMLPATQAEADRAATRASNAFWDHAENCDTCLDAEDNRISSHIHCRTGAPLSQHATDAATVAHDWTVLNDWYRRGGMERASDHDWIAN